MCAILKVLYLTPPRVEAGRLTRYTFVDEEIRALADHGLELFLPTYPLPSAPPPERRCDAPRVHLCELGSGHSVAEYAETSELLLRAHRKLPGAVVTQLRTLFHHARIERFAVRLIQTEGIDVIHSQFGWPHGFGGSLARSATTAPLVATMRGMDVLVNEDLGYGLRRDPLYRGALRSLLRSADVTTHVSDFIRDAAIALGAPPQAALTIRKGVDCTRFRPPDDPPARRELNILTVGGLVRRKGVDHVLDALSLLAPTRAFTVSVVGKGPERERLEERSRRLGLADRTTFHGAIPRREISRFFASCDLFVLGSICEGSGNVLVEALASGRPVVCTSSGGPPEYITDGATGFVVPVADPSAMAAKIGRLLDEPRLRTSFGRRARVHAEQEFSYPKMVDEIVRAYGRALDARRRAAG